MRNIFIRLAFRLKELGALASDFKVRFRTKESSGWEHVYIDDVKIVSLG